MMPRELTRRALLRLAARTPAVFAGTALLAACGGATITTTSTVATSTPASVRSTTTNAATSSTAQSSASTPAPSAATARAAGKTATKVTMLTHWDATTLKVFQPYLTEYQQVNPGTTVDVLTVPFDQLLKKITVSQLSGTGYDIYHIYDLWLPDLLKNNLLAPAPNDVESDVKPAYAPGAVDAVSSQGHLYGYPTEIDTYALNYNKRLFEDVGSVGPPTNWTELLATAHKLTKTDSSGRIIRQGFGTINGWDSGVVHPWLSMLWSNGGDLLAPDFKKSVFNSKQGLETLDLYKQLINEKVMAADLGKAYANNFELGKTAMIIMANWWESGLKSTMKDHFADVATAPIPVGPSGSKAIAVSYVWLYTLNRSSKVQPEAWQFLKWLNGPAATGKSSRMGDWLLSQGILPSRNSDLTAHARELDTPFLKTYVDELQSARPFPVVLGGAEITVDLQKQIEAVEFGNATPEQALTTAQTQVDALLKKNYG
ncbi:MAG: ABC transporter substrate-binding protein [Chloroflexi bacterium]|nr:ABC transporter substrate-binding protein [Chloroflexota bacterium]